MVIALFLVARLLLGLTLKAAAESAKLAAMPYQRRQFWVRRFRQQAEKKCATLAALIAHRRRQTLPPELFGCWNRSAGSQVIGFCLPVCAFTCSAGRRFSLRTVASPHCRRRLRPPERMPKANATELGPKKIGYNPPAMATLCRRVILLPLSYLLPARESHAFSRRTSSKKAPFSLVKLPSGGLGQ